MFPNIDLHDLIGLPYKHCGRDSKTGLDCWGLVVCVYERLGLKVRDLEAYEEEGHKKGYDYFLSREDEWIKKSFPSPYDVVLFVNSAGVAYHSGVITHDLKMIHASKDKGVVIVPLNLAVKCLILDGYYKLKVNDDKSKV